jgi:RNA polymerase sigma factor (sigma-70 family)
MNARTDAELLLAARDTPTAFEHVVLRHHAAIHRYIARRLGSQQADELSGDVFATAFAIRSRYDAAHESARPWLFGIATNLIRRQAKKERQALRRYAAEGADPVAPDATSADVGFDPDLARVLAAMRPQHRDVLFMFAVMELTLDEIAVAMDVPLGTVKSWLSRARDSAATGLAHIGPSRKKPRPTERKP